MSELTGAAESSKLIEQLLPIRNDPDKLLKVLKRQADEESAMKRPRLAPSRPRIPTETFEEVVFFLDRDTLDSMQLAGRFTLDFILKREKQKLALRNISDVEIGKIIDIETEDSWDEHVTDKCWFPVSYVGHGRNGGQMLNSTHRLSTFLRLSHCGDVCINLEHLQGMAKAGLTYHSYTTAEITPENLPTPDNAFGVLFDDLNAKDTTIGVLSVKADKGCEQKACELDGDEEIDFKFKICKHSMSTHVNSRGFKSSRKGEGMWVLDDLPNNVVVEVKETKEVIKIRAYSTA